MPAPETLASHTLFMRGDPIPAKTPPHTRIAPTLAPRGTWHGMAGPVARIRGFDQCTSLQHQNNILNPRKTIIHYLCWTVRPVG